MEVHQKYFKHSPIKPTITSFGIIIFWFLIFWKTVLVLGTGWNKMSVLLDLCSLAIILSNERKLFGKSVLYDRIVSKPAVFVDLYLIVAKNICLK